MRPRAISSDAPPVATFDGVTGAMGVPIDGRDVLLDMTRH